jgi:hypothetical protein
MDRCLKNIKGFHLTGSWIPNKKASNKIKEKLLLTMITVEEFNFTPMHTESRISGKNLDPYCR